MAEEQVTTNAAEAPAAAETAVKEVKRAKTGRFIQSGIAYVLATFNNTKVTFTPARWTQLQPKACHHK